MFRSELWGPVI